MALPSSSINDPERARRIGIEAGNLEELLKRMELESRERQQTGVNLTAAEGHALQYGPGGSAERVAGMQFGPGGAEDRRGEILKPYYGGTGAAHTAQANELAATGRRVEDKWTTFERPKLATDIASYNRVAPGAEAASIAENAFLARKFSTEQPSMTPAAVAPGKKIARPSWYTGQMQEPAYEPPTTFAGGKIGFRPFRSLIQLGETPRRLSDYLSKALFAD